MDQINRSQGVIGVGDCVAMLWVADGELTEYVGVPLCNEGAVSYDFYSRRVVGIGKDCNRWGLKIRQLERHGNL